MTDFVEHQTAAWIPEQLDGPVARPVWLESNLFSLPTDEIRVAPEPTPAQHASASWLTVQIQECVETGHSIRAVMANGRDLVAEHVMRVRALHRGIELRPELRWNGPEIFIGTQLVSLAAAQRRLLLAEGDAAQSMRFRIRVQAMTLESTLMSYAATELVDPQIMDTTLSLDVLCHANYEMTPEVIIRLGLARAYRDEVDAAPPEATFLGDDYWPVVHDAWASNMLYAKGVAKKWAEEVIARGRAGYSGDHYTIRL